MIWFMLTIHHSMIIEWFTSFKILAREYSWRFLCSRKTKVKCPMIISSKFRVGQYRDDGHREDAPHFMTQISEETHVNECTVSTFNLTRNLYQLDEMFPKHSVHQIENLSVVIFFQVASKWIWAYRTFLKNLTFLSKIVPFFQELLLQCPNITA